MTIVAWLLAAIGPLAIRALLTVGFTSVVFTGVTELINALIVTAQTNWAAMPAAVLQLSALSGVPESLGMVFGALVARSTMWVTVSAARFVLKK